MSKYKANPSFSGVITVIPTFFDYFNKINLDGINNHIEKQITSGIKTIVILGTTSETPTLSSDEKLSIVKSVYDKFENKIRIIIGLSGNDTFSVVNECELYSNYGDALMISPPYYNKPSQEGIFQHFEKIITSTNKEIIIYNIPSRCGVNIEPETISKMYIMFDRVLAIKEASGSIDQVIKIKSMCDIDILSGDDGLVLPFMSVGAVGVISVISNVAALEMIKIVESFSKGEINVAIDEFYKIYPLIKLAFIESNPVPIKYLISRINNSLSPAIRLPLVQMTKENITIINKWLDNNFEIKMINRTESVNEKILIN